MTVLFLIVAVAWGLLALVATVGHFCLRRLPARAAAVDAKVSVIVPARNEAERIEGTVQGLLRQAGVTCDVLVVDDGSTDATPDVLARVQAGEARDGQLTVIRKDEVPSGWLGKCHACHVGAALATGDWLLFVDADTWCREDAVRRAVAAAAAAGADHLCLVPSLGRCTLGGQATVLLTMLGLLGIAVGVNRDLPFGYVGVGAFTLIRRSTYEAIGGHAAVRLQVIEDFALGHRVAKQGFRSRLFFAKDAVEVRWAHSVRSLFHVLEKNLFAKLGFRTGRLVVQLVVLLLMWAVPIVGAVVGGWSGYAAAGGMMLAMVPAILTAVRYGWNPLAGILAPLSLPVLGLAALHSARRVLREGGVVWRGVHYPLAALRAAVER